jgi:hypothetical protein
VPRLNVILTCIGIALTGVGLAVPRLEAAGQREPRSTLTAPPVSQPQDLLDRYCVTCHNEQLQTAGLMLDVLDIQRPGEHPEAWEKVVRKLRGRTMPPPGRPRPDEPGYAMLETWLETTLDRAAASRPNPGRPIIHRLNRTEYVNAVRDLLALEVDGRSLLPTDNSAHGFDNIGEALSFSPGLLDRYMSAARKISRRAIGDPTIRSIVETYRVSPLLVQSDRMSDDLPFGSRGGVAIRHHFPLDGEYVVRVRMQKNYVTSTIRGLAEEQRVDVRLDGTRVKLFTLGGPRDTRTAEAEPRTDDQRDGSEDARTADEALEVRFPVKAGTRQVGVVFVGKTSASEGLRPVRYPVGSFAHATDNGAEMAVDSVQIGGPFNVTGPAESVSRRQIFVCYPASREEELPCAKTIISTLARRAYRRPVTTQEVEMLLSFFRAGRREGAFDTGIQGVLERLLVDPNFLFRIERDPVNAKPGTAYRVDGLELASRLSFFLWSSIPDDALLDIAERGQLDDAATLERQVRRMLADPKSRALVTNFAAQWLYVRNLRGITPDSHTFPEFDDNLREAFRLETELFLADQLSSDRSVFDLLKADYTFVNERLARHYQIPNVYGSHFRRVTFSDDRRAGLLGQGGILAVTSYATRTSPVLRGKWLLENILGAPPPAPPPDVPALEENPRGGQPTSVRERMEQHRANPVCASCHKMMDPLGFALENFDAIGAWRTEEKGGATIDASGELPDGTRFETVADLRRILLSKEAFVTTVTEKLLTYALGRGINHYDAPAVRHIVTDAKTSDYRWSSLILGIVRSTPFQMRWSQEP